VNIVVGSAHRNSAGNVSQYMQRVLKLKRLMTQHEVRIIAVEGDSRDRTRIALQGLAASYGLELQLVACSHGGPEFGSVETPERMRALSKVGNAILDAVQQSDDVLFYVESDLLWEPEVAASLITRAAAKTHGWDVVAPLVMAGKCFYDIWGFRGLDGRRFSPFAPFYPGLDAGPVEVGSVGSCFAASGEIARTCRIRDDNCLVGWCTDVRARGYRIAALPDLKVRQV
jgi:hypothetical protein